MTAATSDDEAGAHVPDPAAGAEVPDAAERTRVSLRITTPGISDTEVAAITVALLSATAGVPAASQTATPPAWRQAGLLEASAGRRVRSRLELRHPS